MRRNRVDIAVVDSGICDVDILKGKVDTKIEFLTEGENKAINRYRRSGCVHGTTCAEIISRICPEAHFLDLTAMQPDGTTGIAKLLEALDWCARQRVKLIHLSLGTVNYFDVKLLEERVASLLKQKVIIVAAYHNWNIRTYPAAFPGVFGVRQDREGILNENQFLFQNQAGYSSENSIIAHWWGEDGDYRSNSYAAPVITGYAARVLSEHKDSDFKVILKYLKKNAVSDRRYKGKIQSLISKSDGIKVKIGNRIDENANINIPVIAGSGLCCGEMHLLVNEFESKGFAALLLQEKAADAKVIPMEYYGGTNSSLGQILHTVDIIYKPDIIFLDYLSEKTYSATEKMMIDMFISSDSDTYTITAKGLLRTAKESREISSIIFRYF